jgi:hypothetical protein
MAKRKQATAAAVDATTDTLTAPALPDSTQAQRPELVQPQASEPSQLATEQPAAELPSRLPDGELKSIKLSPDRNSPRLRLLRSYRFNQMQIRSDAPLPEAAAEKLKAEGWKDRTEQEGIWTKQLPPRQRADAPEGAEPAKPAWPVVVDAERVFHDIANAIRSDNKMPPIELERSAAAR